MEPKTQEQACYYDKLSAPLKQELKALLEREPELQKFYKTLQAATVRFIETKAGCDVSFHTSSAHMSDKMRLMWLTSEEFPTLEEDLNVSWRIDFCITCYDHHPEQPFHLDLRPIRLL